MVSLPHSLPLSLRTQSSQPTAHRDHKAPVLPRPKPPRKPVPPQPANQKHHVRHDYIRAMETLMRTPLRTPKRDITASGVAVAVVAKDIHVTGAWVHRLLDATVTCSTIDFVVDLHDPWSRENQEKVLLRLARMLDPMLDVSHTRAAQEVIAATFTCETLPAALRLSLQNVRFMLRFSDCTLPSWQEAQSSLRMSVRAQTKRVVLSEVSPPFLTWLREHRVRYFNPHTPDLFLCMARYRAQGACALVQPRLIGGAMTHASEDVKKQALQLLLPLQESALLRKKALLDYLRASDEINTFIEAMALHVGLRAIRDIRHYVDGRLPAGQDERIFAAALDKVFSEIEDGIALLAEFIARDIETYRLEIVALFPLMRAAQAPNEWRDARMFDELRPLLNDYATNDHTDPVEKAARQWVRGILAFQGKDPLLGYLTALETLVGVAGESAENLRQAISCDVREAIKTRGVGREALVMRWVNAHPSVAMRFALAERTVLDFKALDVRSFEGVFAALSARAGADVDFATSATFDNFLTEYPGFVPKTIDFLISKMQETASFRVCVTAILVLRRHCADRALAAGLAQLGGAAESVKFDVVGEVPDRHATVVLGAFSVFTARYDDPRVRQQVGALLDMLSRAANLDVQLRAEVQDAARFARGNVNKMLT